MATNHFLVCLTSLVICVAVASAASMGSYKGRPCDAEKRLEACSEEFRDASAKANRKFYNGRLGEAVYNKIVCILGRHLQRCASRCTDDSSAAVVRGILKPLNKKPLDCDIDLDFYS